MDNTDGPKPDSKRRKRDSATDTDDLLTTEVELCILPMRCLGCSGLSRRLPPEVRGVASMTLVLSASPQCIVCRHLMVRSGWGYTGGLTLPLTLQLKGQLLKICRLHIHDANLPFHHIPKVLYWIEIW
ncbi:hypothetical protein N1851_005881 [Merluccius polli]|uniref:Uncharacterized protein n=1 Tax=Merluccius polli TaxID=89951 RepID=A0AA47N6R1_MERPO|nr:hypothetical protein N1851_005881 [Merluccius polli]